ncbi:MAG: hypothetical protein MJ002_00350 [Paludibacteraceae bacterium]|nr:hypothetical protein [Paludibacteraceae bacterium]
MISKNNKRIAKNTFFLYLRMFVVLGVSLYTSRVILEVLGVEDYGIYNVVGGFVALFGFFNSTLSSSMQRFYNFEMGKAGESGISKVYSTGLWIHVGISVITVLLLETIGLWYINNVMVIPEERLLASNVVFHAVVFSMMLVILQIPYSGFILAYERMDFYAIMSVVEVSLKLGIVIILPFANADKLITYSLLLSVISIINSACYFVYAKKISGSLKLVGQIDYGMLKEILSFSGWNLLGTFAFTFKGQGLNVLLNYFFGPIVNAARGISYQINAAVSGFYSNIALAFRPQLVDSYAKGDRNRVLSLFYMESKVCFSLMLLLTIPVITETDFLLTIWLGDNVPTDTGIFTKLVLIGLLFGCFNQPVVQLAFATGRIKRFQIATSIVNALLFLTSFLLLILGMDAVSVFVCTIVYTIINQCVCVYELNRLYPIGIRKYLHGTVTHCFIVMLLSYLVPALVCHSMHDGYLRFLTVGFADMVVTPLLVYRIIMDPSERGFIRDIVLNKTKRHAKS